MKYTPVIQSYVCITNIINTNHILDKVMLGA